jgi:hypothetical protein
MFRPAEGPLGVDDPVVVEERPQLGQRQEAAVELKLPTRQRRRAAGGDPACVIRREAAGGQYAVDMGMKTSAPTIPCSRKATRSRFTILSIRFMVLLFRSYEGPSGEMARSVSSIEAENG